MGLQTGTRIDRYVDREVIQRILKFLDVAVLFCASIVISLLSTVNLAATSPQVIGFLAAELALICVFGMRALGLYNIKAMTQAAWTALRAAACCFILGGALFALTHVFLLEMDYGWLYLWMAVLPVYFGLTRGLVSLWASPRANSGRFRQRIAIVGGGKAAEEALNLLETSRGLDIEHATVESSAMHGAAMLYLDGLVQWAGLEAEPEALARALSTQVFAGLRP